MIKGLILGKFYPPHRGHKILINEGLAQTDHLTVIVCELSSHKIPGKLRAKWIKQMHPKAKVIVKNYDDIEPWNSKLWADLAVKWGGFKPDVVFTSEAYGEPWAKEIGCQHVLVDKGRKKYPISGTKIRENPKAYWEFLEPPVKKYYTKNLAV